MTNKETFVKPAETEAPRKRVLIALKSDPFDTAITPAKAYATKTWGEGAKKIIAQLDELAMALKQYRTEKVSSTTPWNFGDPKLTDLIEKNVNKFVKQTNIMATHSGSELSFAYVGPAVETTETKLGYSAADTRGKDSTALPERVKKSGF